MYLIDTHVLIWILFDADNLSDDVKEKLEDNHKVYVSIASLWEIAIKQSIGKLDINYSICQIASKCKEANIEILTIKPEHLEYIHELPLIHNDPFDRLIISQAVVEGLSLISKDEKIARYDKPLVIW